MTDNPSAEMTRSDLVEFSTHSFVIKMWLEATPTDAKKSWRGHITHIPGGERLYVTSVFCILNFVTSYLKSMGIKFGRFWWIKDWLNSRKVHTDIDECGDTTNSVNGSSKLQNIKTE